MRNHIFLLILVAGALLLAGIMSLSFFTVNEKEYVIITRFGRTIQTLDKPDWYFKWPLVDTVNRLDKRLHIFKNQPIELLLQDRNPIMVGCYICWNIQDPDLFFRRVRTVENASQKIGDMINSQLGSVLGSYDLDNIINVNAEQVRLDEIETRVRDNTAGTASVEYGIEIQRMGIRRLSYPTIVEDSVIKRMQAEREKEAKKYRAEGRKEAAQIEAQTDLEVKKIMAEAYRDAQILKGQGDQEAMGIYAAAYGKDKDFYEFLKSLEVYKESFQENTTLILSTDSELFKYLNYSVKGAGHGKDTATGSRLSPDGKGEGDG